MIVTIHITKEILEESKMCRGIGQTQEQCLIGQNCAIGKAVCSLFGSNIWVSHRVIAFYKDGLKFNPFTGSIVGSSDFDIRLPLEAMDFIKSFDQSSADERVLMSPISFDIDIPDGVIDLIGIEQAMKAISESKSLSISN